jgi:hypothetical protein
VTTCNECDWVVGRRAVMCPNCGQASPGSRWWHPFAGAAVTAAAALVVVVTVVDYLQR